MTHVTVDTKQRLIDTALELIWKSSYGSVSVDDICKAADVKKGSFYHFFPSKVDLAIASMEESYKAMKPLYDGIFSAGTPPLERFARLAEFVYESQMQAAAKYGRVCGCPCASLGSEMAGQEMGIRAKFDDIAHRQERYYENALRDMVADGVLPPTTNVKVKAEEAYAYILGLLMFARIQNDLEPLKRDLKPGLMRLLGLTADASQAA
jgi:TetR/AcrR family transcriptional repressor of nem operon